MWGVRSFPRSNVCDLKQFLPKIISGTQSAFMSRRHISDNIFIAQKMFHGLQTNSDFSDNFMVVKTDISKAYDMIE